MRKIFTTLLMIIISVALMNFMTACVPSYTLSFETNGGNNVESIKFNMAKDTLSVTPSKDGFTFMGWFLDNDTFLLPFNADSLNADVTLYAKWLPTINIYLDQHSHTIHSDGSMTVRQSVIWHRDMGFNTVVISDHNTLSNSAEIIALREEFADEILIIQGMEWTTARVHINFVGLTSWDFDAFPVEQFPTNEAMTAAIAEAHRQGAIVTVNHFLWTQPFLKFTREELLSFNVDYFEINNDDCRPNDYYDLEGICFCEANGLGQITGTDVHNPAHITLDGKVHAWTKIETTAFTVDAVMEQLRLRNTEVIIFETPKDSVPVVND